MSDEAEKSELSYSEKRAQNAIPLEQVRWAVELIAEKSFAPSRENPGRWTGRDLIINAVGERFHVDRTRAGFIVGQAVKDILSESEVDPKIALRMTIVRFTKLRDHIFRLLTSSRSKKKLKPAVDEENKPIMVQKKVGGKMVERQKLELVHIEKYYEVDSALFQRFMEVEDRLVKLQGLDKIATQESLARELRDHLEKATAGDTVALPAGSKQTVAQQMKVITLDQMTEFGREIINKAERMKVASANGNQKALPSPDAKKETQE